MSNYNVFFPYEDKIIGVNTLGKNYVILEKDLFNILNKIKSDDDIQRLKEIHIDFYDYLINNKFIVEDNIDEVKQCIDYIKSKIHNEKLYELHINPTMNCNFNCWYCYETHLKNSRMNDDTQQNILRLVNNILDSQPKLETFQVNLFGGEPLLSYDSVIINLIPQIRKLVENKNLNFVALLISNGLMINEDMLDFFKDNNFTGFQITLDGHRERHNQVRYISKTKGSYDKIIQNIILLAKNGFQVSVRINLSKETFEDGNKIIDDFINFDNSIKEHLLFDFHFVWQEKEKDFLDKKRKHLENLFKEAGFRISDLEFNIFDKQCYADKVNNANINYNGDVFKCTARDYDTENREGVLNNDGTIEWNEKYHMRMDSLFKNKPCFNCNIFPICGGGCTQNALERGEDYCIYNFDEKTKLDIVKNHFFGTVV